MHGRDKLYCLVSDWTKGRFTLDSGYYAGRGPTKDDLNSRHLEMLYEGIKKDISAEAATNFVRFVNNLEDLSASAFIVAFERFAASGFTMTSVEQKPEDGNRVTGYGAVRDAQAFAVMAHALTKPKQSEAELRRAHDCIKAQFILRHKDEIPPGEWRG